MNLEISLNEHEARLLGVLIEKELTTPDNYPLTLNAAVNAANQKSNRYPVVDYTEAEVWVGFTGLIDKGLGSKLVPAGSNRVEKFKHTSKNKLSLELPQLAILAELLLRGPQTPGELRTRVSRMSPIETLDKLGALIDSLIDRSFIKQIAPAPGSRAERFMQLIAPDLHPLDETIAPPPVIKAGGGRASELEQKVDALEEEVHELRIQIASMAKRLEKGLLKLAEFQARQAEQDLGDKE